MSLIRQLSLFGVEASAPEPGDLAGLLIAGGEIGRVDDAAQVSVVVNHPWRAAALVGECARRGLAATSVSTVDSYVGVRTAFASSLLPLARDWTDDAGLRVPRDLRLGAATLRLWTMAVGHFAGSAYVLPVGDGDQRFRDIVGAALARIGLPAQLASRRGPGGRHPSAGSTFRIVGKRRLDRLVEMVGDPPKQAPAGSWPS